MSRPPLSRASVLVLAEPDDALARRVASAVHRSADVVWLTPSDLVLGRWVHDVEAGAVRSRIKVSGTWHDFGDVVATLNRVRRLPPAPAAFAAQSDREYAMAERHALVLSALAGLSAPVVNPPSPPSLSGADLTPAGWLRLAASLGLPVRPLSLTTDARAHPRPGWAAAHWPSLEPLAAGVPIGRRPVAWMAPIREPVRRWVVGDAVDGADVHDLARLARAGDCLLLEVVVARDERDVDVVASADPHPPDVPDVVAAALADLLLSRVAVS